MFQKAVYCVVAIILSFASFAQKEYIGSTPADSDVRTALNISQAIPVDFIRWSLNFPRPRKFILNINYGEGQPNTSGFKNGGTKATIEGMYEIRLKDGVSVYTLRTGNTGSISLKMINDQLVHVLSKEGKLMVGNGGWSYTLSRKNTSSPNPLRPLKIKSKIRTFPDSITIFEGRFPCQEISEEYDFSAPSDCFKLKWLLTFTKDSVSYSSGTFVLNRTLERANLIKGRWNIDSTGKIDLAPEKGPNISFVAGDENVLFFTDRKGALFIGNENFSYTLNRRRKNL